MSKQLLGVSLLALVACSPADERATSAAPAVTQRQALVTAFAAGSLIIPMDTTSQNNGTLRAFGLVDSLLRANVRVHRIALAGKAAGGNDFTATVNQREGGAVLGSRTYRGGPFVIAAADATAAALAVVDAYLATDTVTNVHVATAAFNADVQRTLESAPRIAVLRDGNEGIAYAYLNAANIRDSLGNTWTDASPGALTLTGVAGVTGGAFDGTLFTGGIPAWDQLTSMHYDTPASTEVVREVRGWLVSSPNTHAYMQCEAVLAFENDTNGRFLTTTGLANDSTPTPLTVLQPSSLFAQFDGALTADTGSLDSMRVPVGGALRSNSSVLIAETGSPLGRDMLWLTGYVDGNTNNGKISYLAGHNYSTALPISANPQTNGTRLFLDSLYETSATFAGSQPTLTLTKSAPTLTNGTNFTYTLSYSNAGPGTAQSANVVDVLPTGTTFVSATGGGVHSLGTVTWALGTLASGASGSVTVTVTSAADGVFANQARINYQVGLTPKLVLSNTTSTTVDRTAPDSTLTSTPPLATTSTSGSFTFTATEPGSTFQCSLDGAAFTTCTSPSSVTGLADGPHTFQVRATDPAGNTDATPASHTWTVDTTAPDTTLTSAPPALSSSATSTFAFTSTEAGTFECSVDGAAFTACTSPLTTAALADGPHTFRVRAIDALGNTDTTPATHSWTIDTTPPDTTFTSGPPATTNSATSNFTFTSTEAGSFQCSLDGGAFVACTSPLSVGPLADGPHTVRVRAVDSAGNVDPTPASYAWAIDTAAPDTTFTSTPPAQSNSTSGAFAFTSNEPGATFQCSVDGGAFAACSSPTTFSGLSQGNHTVRVRAVDAAGNLDATPASFTWNVDTAPPDTTFTSTPPAQSNSTSGTFAFTSNEAGATFQCSLDGAAFTACSSPTTFSGLSQGSHTVRVRAVDPTGNIDPTPASHTWNVDTAAPDTSFTSTPPAVTNSTSGTFAFTSTEAGGTFQCSLDGAAFTPCTSPTTFSGLSQGSHTVRVQAIDPAGNVDPTPVSYTWSVDTTPPDTSFTSTPPAATSSTSGTFAFTSTEAGGTFECSLDGAAFVACTSPTTFSGLTEGSHTVQVRARDAGGNVDPTPASYTWSVDVTAPDTTLTSAPPAATSSTSATFTFTSSQSGGTFECSLDGAAFTTCTTPLSLTGLAEGNHTFAVRALDAAGNVDPTPATHAWRVDRTEPDTSISAGPSGTVSSATAAFTFTSNEAGATFECSLDGGAYAACPAMHSLTGLSDGAHTLSVRAVDAAGNVDATPATRTWTVDTGAPDTTLTSAPSGTVNVSTATLTFTSNEPGATFECSVDGAAFTACTSPLSLSALADGPHTVRVRAIDAGGNVDPTPATATWTVDAREPDTTIATGPSGTVGSTTADFTFTSTKPNSTFECSLDGAPYTACTASSSFPNLMDGSHTLSVRAIDPGGNVDATPATRTWTVDTDAPDTTIATRPPAASNSSSAAFTFTSDESTATFECSLDGGAFAACPASHSLSSLADGLHVLLVRAVDAAGNRDATPALATWTVDTRAPTAPLILEPVANATTGALPRFGGTAEPGSTVTVTVDGQSVCTASVSSTGAWSCTGSTPLSAGPHTATATATDPAGNTSMPSMPRAFTVDTSAPDTRITSGPSALTNSTDAAFTLAADRAGATFECSLDGAAFMACTASPLLTGLSEGAHRLEVRAVSNGVADPSPAVATWTVDSMAPGAPVITSPTANATTSATPTFTGTAEPGSTVTVSVDGAPVCTALADASGSFSCAAPSAFTPGAHQVTATTRDAAGNVSPASTPVPFTVDGATLDTAIIAGPSGTVRSTSADFAFSSTVLGASFECSLDGAAFVPCSTPTTFSNLSEGSHTLTVRAVNGMSVDATPASRTWVVDSMAPTTPTVTAPADGATVYTRLPRYAGTAEPGSTVRVSVDDQLACTAVTASDGTWSCTGPTQLSSGPHKVTASATDAAGNVSAPSNPNTFTVVIPMVVVALTSPADGTLTNDSTPTLTGTATPDSTVTVFIDGMAVGTATADAQGQWTFTPATPLSDGEHTLTARAEFMGFTSPTSDPVTLTVDTKAPVVTTTVNQPDPATPPTVTFTSNEPNVTYQCSVDGGDFAACASPFDTSMYGSGNHTVVVRATDAAGNTSETTQQWQVVDPLVEQRPDLYIRGGGCGCGETDGSALALLGLMLLTLFARRRGVRRSVTPRAAGLAAVLVVSTSASAQVAGFEVERLDLNPGAASSLIIATGDVLPRGVWRASLLAHYQHDSLLLYRSDTQARVGSIIGSRVTAHLMGAWAPLDWLEVGLQLPVVVFQGGDDLQNWGVAKVAPVAMGTPWVTGRFALLRQANDLPLDLALQLGLGLPFGSPGAYTQVSPLGFTPRLSLGRDFTPWLRLGAELGFLVRAGSASAGLSTRQQGTGSTFSWAVSALGKHEASKVRGELTVRGLVEFDAALSGTELLAGLRFPVHPWVELVALGGPGFGPLPGTPAFRAMVGVAVSPPPEPAKAAPVCDEQTTPEVLARDCASLDADGDGVLNGVDACVRVKGVAARQGCPIPDTDGDGLTDDVDQCVSEAGPRERNGCPLRDRDHDGVEDATDACPDEAGPAERNGCPLRDKDGDTVEDDKDDCPTEAGPVERRGCPVKDGDGDGVEDVIDNCPTEKGAVDNAGCPAKQKQLVVITADRLVIKEKVFFATGKSVVLPRSFPLLDNVASVLVGHPEVELVRVEGHTDAQGKREANVKLSQARAEAVKTYLVKKGVAAERLKAVGFGPDSPTAPNDTPAGREQNRRVEFNFEAVKH